jgi:hypothetical protein
MIDYENYRFNKMLMNIATDNLKDEFAAKVLAVDNSWFDQENIVCNEVKDFTNKHKFLMHNLHDTIDQTNVINQITIIGDFSITYALNGINFLLYGYTMFFLTAATWEDYFKKLYEYNRLYMFEAFIDIVRIGVTISTTLNMYTSALNVHDFYESCYSDCIISFIILFGFIMEAINIYYELQELQQGWEAFKSNYSNECKNLEAGYNEKIQEMQDKLRYMEAIIASRIALLVFSFCYLIQQLSPNIATQFISAHLPALQIVITCLVFLYHLKHATRQYWDADYAKLDTAQKKQIFNEALFNAGREIAKFVLITVTVVFLSSMLHSLPGLIIIGAIIFASNLLVNSIADVLGAKLIDKESMLIKTFQSLSPHENKAKIDSEDEHPH